jgi:hypothetical protein
MRRYGQQKLDGSTFVGGRYQFEFARFDATRHNIEKTQLLHHQGFDVHISPIDISKLIFRAKDLTTSHSLRY